MRSVRTYAVLVAACLVCAPATGSLVISEFMSINKSTVADENGDFRDWVEIYNAGDTAVDLAGWTLSDSKNVLDKWTFPEMELSPGNFLLVFCSGKDRRDPAGQLHTNFRITSEGEFIALTRPDGTIASQFGPEFPTQVPYASYGTRMSSISSVAVPEGVTVRYHVPMDDSLGLTWTDPDFDDTAWASGAAPIGFDDKNNPTFTDLIRTNLMDAMRRVNSSIYVRVPFVVEDPGALNSLILHVRFEDGLAAYLNGQEVARINTRDELDWEARALRPRPDEEALVPADVNLSRYIDLLRPGTNVLAIHGLNSSTNNTDFFLAPELEAISVTGVDLDVFNYFESATPGWANSQGFTEIADAPTFSIPSGAIVDDTMLAISTTVADGEIRYTLDQTEPTASSTLYEGPLAITSTTIVKARVFSPSLLRSPVVTSNILKLDASLRDVESNLPLMMIDTFRRNPNGDTLTPCFAMLIDRGENGLTRLTDPAQFSGPGGIKKRGSSSGGWPKNNFGFEAWDENQEDIDVEMLDMPAESDWVLHGPYSDKSLMRNALSYEWSNAIGQYAVRTRYIELYYNANGGDMAASDYWGTYVLMEKIKRGENRVNVEPLDPEATEGIDVTGGYIFKKDRLDPGDTGFRTPGGGGYPAQTIAWVYPKERSLTAQAKTPAQQAYVSDFFRRFEAALYGDNFADPEEGYQKYVDVDSFIDHHIMVEITKNIDGYRLSTFFYKKKDTAEAPGKLYAGPIWDYNLSLGNADYLEGGRPVGWYYPLISRDQYPWWPRMQEDPAFMRRYQQRWRQFRKGPFSIPNLEATIQKHADEIRESAARNFVKWRVLGIYLWPNFFIAKTWDEEVTWMTGWLKDRVAFMDGQLTETPAFDPPGGPVEKGTEVTLSVSDGEIYYTLDGTTDPRAADGTVAPGATLYGSPIVVTRNTKVSARSFVAGVWSALVEEVYITDLAPLAITEIMYNPPEPPAGSEHNASQFEFIEFQNVGDSALDMKQFAIDRGVRLDFADVEGDVVLAPGALAVAVRNLAAFSERYGTEGIQVLAEYSGSFSDSGETVAVIGRLGEVVREFAYDDEWYPTTDGGGFSLTLIDPIGTVATEDLEKPESWRPSSVAMGTPGKSDGTVGPAGLVRPGDTNGDARLNITDGVTLLAFLFGQPVVELPCGGDNVNEGGNKTLFDANGDGSVNLTDGVHVLNYLFGNGDPHALGSECTRIEGCQDTCNG